MLQLPLRIRLAIIIGHLLPPLFAATITNWLYSLHHALSNNLKVRVPAQTGSFISCEVRDNISYEFMVHGYWDWRVAAIVSTLVQSGDTVIECGANIGTETVIFSDFAEASGHVYSFEPLPSIFTKLKENVSLFHYTNTTLLSLALADKVQELSFVVPPEVHSGGGFLATEGIITVDCTTLDEQAETFNRVKLIHMDIEGAEILALRGATKLIKRYKPYLIVEAFRKNLSRFGFTIGDLYATLKDDYDVYQISRFGLSKVQLTGKPPHCNWLCIPKGQEEVRRKINKQIKIVGITPCVPGLNPISKWKLTDLIDTVRTKK